MSRSLCGGPATHAAGPPLLSVEKTPAARRNARRRCVKAYKYEVVANSVDIAPRNFYFKPFFKQTKALFPPRNDDRFNLPRIHLEEDVDYTAEPASVAQIDYFFFSEITDSAAMHNTHPLISIYMRTPACTWCKKTKIKNPLNKAVQLRAEMIRQNMEAADLP